MKTGLIIYVAGDHRSEGSVDTEKRIEALEVDADLIEVITHNSGHFDISDAWWSLTTRGMQRIICKIAEYTRNGHLRFTGREMRICG